MSNNGNMLKVETSPPSETKINGRHDNFVRTQLLERLTLVDSTWPQEWLAKTDMELQTTTKVTMMFSKAAKE